MPGAIAEPAILNSRDRRSRITPHPLPLPQGERGLRNRGDKKRLDSGRCRNDENIAVGTTAPTHLTPHLSSIEARRQGEKKNPAGTGFFFRPTCRINNPYHPFRPCHPHHRASVSRLSAPTFWQSTARFRGLQNPHPASICLPDVCGQWPESRCQRVATCG